MAGSVPPRSDVPKEYTWNLESVFASDEAWQSEFDAVAAAIGGIEHFPGHLADGAAILADWCRVSDDLLRRVYTVFVYASMQHDADTAYSEAQSKNDRATSLWGRVATACAFAEPEILELGMDVLRGWMESEPELRRREHYFDALYRRREHVRSADVEAVLGLVQDPFLTAASTHRMLTDTDLRFSPARTAGGDTIEIAQGNIDALLRDADREVRRSAWEHYADAHLAMRNTMATALLAGVKQDVFFARARKYESSLEASLDPGSVPLAVYHNLIETYRRHLPVWHRYWRVRRKALGYDTLREYDIKAPLAVRQQFPFSQAVEWVTHGMRPLGDEYLSVLKAGVLEQRWVDVYPNENKRGGAYSSGAPGTYPFILMSYEGGLESMSTLAHELGHSMHSYLTWHHQPLVYSDYSMFVAEVASNFNQALVRAHLLETSHDPDFQIAVIEEAMSNFHRYFFIMPSLARFELEMHERAERDEGLNAESLSALMAELFGEGYGDELRMDKDRTGITWAEFSGHLYMNFYVYQYATGISAAHSLAEGVLSGSSEARERYLEFLKTGDSVYPLQALELAGVDMTSPEPIERTFGIMEGMIDRLEQLVEQRGSPAAARSTGT
ncbi:MAG: oligoendopeptidase F [Chloroflexota bacterium]|nr:MAG: oligoendopeptidase F [Chloroflexota bacterium]